MRKNRRAVSRSLWGRIGYVGEAFTAADGTYKGVRVAPLNFMTTHDGGARGVSAHPALIANLAPLILAALWESAFAGEAGVPLSTWRN